MGVIWLLLMVPTYLVPWATNDGGEDSPGGVITGETGLAHAGAIVNDQSSCVFVTHLDSFLSQGLERTEMQMFGCPDFYIVAKS